MNIQNLLSYNFYNLFFYFIIYSFLGWCVEVLYAYKNQKKFVNRGFLHGPLCPIYGLCISSMVIVLDNINVTLPLLLIVATIVISTIEYLTGYILEKLFKTKYWDYTDDPFNIHGRICLHFSIMWGITSVGVVKIIHPLVKYIVTSITPLLSTTLFYLLFILLIFDFAHTISKLVAPKKFDLNIQLGTLLLFNRFKK
ncbi:MAG: putative ABC transporter permease [Clostridium sp.]|uniref:putative ABC transporter permease n=1 Tax=Clostridium TaxID=1485 RepID=UPI00232DD5AE|nr:MULTISPECIES: putative ABC transporter permease [Clostridium]MDB2118886.1 putative ABC transporter permease [Clostridium paraputrificum]MDU2755208.1 putative ABC transporter permease [Clostridium sp.]MDU2900207.1 putative ABC transporter permease [Clostridium sp.]MDU4425950.1 putative ABC transporter permease [Clostridium sp.]MDU7460407.1 putative ABC transporter permease [Clostridium sp.]